MTDNQKSPSDYIPPAVMLRELHAADYTDREIADAAGMHTSSINRLRAGKTTKINIRQYFIIYELFRRVYPRGTVEVAS